MPLTTAHRRTLAALGDTMFPSLGPGDPSGAAVLPDALDDFLAHVDAKKARTFGLVLTVFELAAVARYGRPFSKLAPETRARYVDGWMRSRLAPRRIVFRTLKMLCGTLYYQDARTWASLAYDGPLVGVRAANGAERVRNEEHGA
jgi:hypothetical protein